MRRLAGAILLALALSTVVVAEQRNGYLPQSRQRQFNLDSDHPSARTFNTDRGLFTTDDLRGLQSGENVCYTMHTLVVAREKDTDSTRIVRQQTCTPSDRFRVNHSVKPPRVVR